VESTRGPRRHLFVCANRREDSPLGNGCGARGEALYDALKAEVGARGLVGSVWVTKTHCLGICPKEGATVAQYPSTQPILTEVRPADAAALLEAPPTSTSAAPPPGFEAEIASLEELQRGKVLDLARRLKPGLTMEDVQNPHDFPELDDPDWHYADGVLTGIASVKSLLAARRPNGG
jgi:(2Fe-2S) ferredoxin